MNADLSRGACVLYRNHRGNTAWRNIVPQMGSLRFEATEFHSTPQWVFDAWDLDKRVERTFALSGVEKWELRP